NDTTEPNQNKQYNDTTETIEEPTQLVAAASNKKLPKNLDKTAKSNWYKQQAESKKFEEGYIDTSKNSASNKGKNKTKTDKSKQKMINEIKQEDAAIKPTTPKNTRSNKTKAVEKPPKNHKPVRLQTGNLMELMNITQ